MDDFDGSSFAHQELSDHVRGSDCGGQSYHLKLSLGNPAQPLQCYRELASSLILSQLVNFIDNQETNVSKVTTKDAARKNRLKSLWSGNQEIRRTSGLAGSLLDLGIAISGSDLAGAL